MKKIVFLVLIMLAGLNVQAQQKKDKNAKYDIEVKGNCEQCKKRIEKAAFNVKGVKMATWNEDEQLLHLTVDENKCSAEDVRNAVAKSGHDTDKAKAVKEDYNKLPMCCQYKRS
ncbi:heavy-metal-associated domain-containing protein [Flavobacterium rhizosphaerae]|uniref:Heavy-metal-associated domain-containing protein n=1 Tax=Flavobacterium rhizosphaerae TaxID=3163298 RepID=A0ABW8YUS5_9FLAO